MCSSSVCGQPLFQEFKFLNTHSKILEKFLPLIFQTSKLNVKFVFLFACSRHIMNPVFSIGGAVKGGGRAGGLQPPNPETNKKTGFVDIMISNRFRGFSFSRNQPLKSADD
jgi:hypothetical protein